MNDGEAVQGGSAVGEVGISFAPTPVWKCRLGTPV
jgi:hypothetical protein